MDNEGPTSIKQAAERTGKTEKQKQGGVGRDDMTSADRHKTQ